MAKTWLTQGQYDTLLKEYKNLTEVERPRIIKLIDEARQEGDLKENGGYHAAREEQSRNETRILQLEELLRDAEVGDTPADDGVVEPGMVVTARILGEEQQFLLGTRAVRGELDITVYSADAPLGKAIIGARQGETVSYTAPNGNEIAVEIISATPFEG
ncbi:transcription elongation factor GreA [Actinomycetaceae bacterium WB03_NA08]|uniref:Transcription elongation factor GreA n=1 Tax=Scrofimicrobium canadense TaxID=2652290 RepID=A0A6N7VNX4_9ACTO|nr:transcription elongation factor GreA [Scrofimicrobium canadense]MSS83424.1 transcription elongation factor GreA [Scrofimicrobium canadense]